VKSNTLLIINDKAVTECINNTTEHSKQVTIYTIQAIPVSMNITSADRAGGTSGQGVGSLLTVGSGERIFLNFQVKKCNAGLMHFLLRKTTLVARNWDQGGLIDPLGAEDVKCTGG